MHKLDRPTGPICLSHYQHGRDNWNSVTHGHKNEIRTKLNEMQMNRCAYCECSTLNEWHIEHFRQRNNYPQGTFDWNNLFGSCNRNDSCGKYKDRQSAYSYQDIIKMDGEDPDRFLRFLPDGNVVEKENLSVADHRKATETIRVFNLKALRQIRKTYIAGYLKTAKEFADAAEGFTEEEWLSLIQEELDQVKNLPFCTAIRHVLLGL